MNTDIKTCAFLRVFMEDIRRKNALHASCKLSRRQPIQRVTEQLACEFFRMVIVKDKIQESIAGNVDDKAATYNSTLYVFTDDELCDIINDLASNLLTRGKVSATKPQFPKPQVLDHSLLP